MGVVTHVQINIVDIQDNIADIFNKVLQGENFTSFQKYLMG